MFQNISELNAAMKEILETIQQGNEIKTLFSKYPDELSLDLVKAINNCLSNGYLTGINCEVGSHNDVVINTPNPQVTSLGTRFILEN